MNRMASPASCVVRLYYYDERREARSTRLCLPIVVAAVCGIVSTTTVNAREPESRAFCRDPGFAAGTESSLRHPRLKARDEGFRRSDFATFRRELQDYVARKDE